MCLRRSQHKKPGFVVGYRINAMSTMVLLSAAQAQYNDRVEAASTPFVNDTIRLSRSKLYICARASSGIEFWSHLGDEVVACFMINAHAVLLCCCLTMNGLEKRTISVECEH